VFAQSAVPLHGNGVPETAAMAPLVVLGGLGAAALLGLAGAAFVRRRSRPYLLVVAAFGALFARSVVAWLSVTGALAPTAHHLLEHGLDVVLAAAVVAAVYYARTVRGEGQLS
jgi:hypothetical protein